MHGTHLGASGSDSRPLRRGLVEILRRDGHLGSGRVAAALLAVPRELFVPGVPLDEVYRPSNAIVTKRVDGISVSSASSPEVMALMLEQLDPQPGDRVLEIGAGTGYNAALLAHLVGETGQVTSLDIDEDLVLGAREHLRSAGYGQVRVVLADGALGYASPQLYDRIILTVASTDIAPAWQDQLARPHGRLVLPLGLRGLQRCVAFRPEADHLVCRSARDCSFIALRGVLAASPAQRVRLDPGGARVISGADDEVALPLSAEAINEQLKAPARILASGVSTSLEQLRGGLHLWLITHQSGVYPIWGSTGVPDLFGVQEDVRGTLSLMDETGLVLLAWSDEARHSGELLVHTPVGSEGLARRAVQQLRQWEARGRPMDADLVIRAYERSQSLEPDSPARGELVIDQRWSRFALSWRNQPPAIFTV